MHYNHFIITGFLTGILYFIYSKNENPQKLYSLLTILLILNLSTFNIYLLLTNTYNYKVHLPLHLCYITELSILVSIIFNMKSYYPWLLLNSLGGGMTGFLNSDLEDGSMFIEYTHLYLSHFNLLLFALFLYKTKYIITKSDFYKSILFNVSIFAFAVFFNMKFGSNYWFTQLKPPGINLANIMPDSYYLLILIVIGLSSYYFTFKLFEKNEVNRPN